MSDHFLSDCPYRNEVHELREKTEQLIKERDEARARADENFASYERVKAKLSASESALSGARAANLRSVELAQGLTLRAEAAEAEVARLRAAPPPGGEREAWGWNENAMEADRAGFARGFREGIEAAAKVYESQSHPRKEMSEAIRALAAAPAQDQDKENDRG